MDAYNGKMPRLFVLVLVGLLAITRVTPASACVNATMSENEAIAKLKDAERALDIGDVTTARQLANETRVSHHPGMGFGYNEESARLFDRAMRIAALSHVRDPDATPEELDSAWSNLKMTVEAHDGLGRGKDPALEADYGEALERAGKNDDAYDVLAPLADRNLVGSAYALGALARAAEQRGDFARAETARQRCETIAVAPSVCGRAALGPSAATPGGVNPARYPRPPFLWKKLHGTPAGYVAPAFVLLGALALGRVLRRRRREPWASLDAAARSLAASSVRAKVLPAVVLAGGALLFVVAAHEVLGVLVALSLAAFALDSRRRAFFAAVRRGDARARAFTLQSAEDADAHLPSIASLFGPRRPETLERTEDPAYRDAARTPLVRLTRRSQRSVLAFSLAALAMLVFAGCGAATLVTARSRSSVERAPIPLSLD